MQKFILIICIFLFCGCSNTTNSKNSFSYKKMNKSNELEKFKTGKNLFELEKYEESISMLDKALLTQKEVFGDNHKIISFTYNYLGRSHFKLGEYNKSLEYLFKALEIQKDILKHNHKSKSTTYNYIGRNYFELGEYDKSLKYLIKALEIQKEIFGTKHKSIAVSYNRIGRVYLQLGKDEKSLTYLNRAIEIDKSIFGVNSKRLVVNYNLLGGLYFQLSDYKKAFFNLNKALEIGKNTYGLNHINISKTQILLAKIYFQLKNNNKSLVLLNKALEIQKKVLKSNDINIAKTYNLIGKNHLQLKNYSNALVNLNKSLNMYKSKFGEIHNSIAKNYNDIGRVYYKKGDYKKALAFGNKALAIEKKVFGLEHRNTAMIYKSIARVYIKLKNYDEAFKKLFIALEIEKKVLVTDHINITATYTDITNLYKEMNDHPNTYKYAKKSFDIFLKNRDKNFAILDNKQKLKYVKLNNNKLDMLLKSSFLYQKQLIKEQKKEKSVKIKEETLDSWLNYKGAIFDSENSLSILYEKVKDKKIKEKIKELNLFKQSLSKLYQTIAKPKERKNHEKKIKQLEKDISNNEIFLSTKLSEFKEEQGLNNIKYTDISLKLKYDEIYLDFAKTKSNYFIFTLDNENNILFEMISEVNTKNINKNIKKFRKNLDNILKSNNLTKNKLNNLTNDSKDILSELNSNIFNNKNKMISKIKYKDTLILSLDGALNFLPFEALYDKENKQYLIEKKNIKYVPSGKEFLRLLGKKFDNKISKDVVVFTNPDYGLKLPIERTNNRSLILNTRGTSFLHKSLFSMIFKPLPGTIEESRIISDLFLNVQDYNQEEATSTKLFKVNSPKILHISTHGFFLKDKGIKNPMLKSGLAFTGANMARVRGDGQGVVTGLKLAGLNLSNTDLVVLSACETGVGDINDAEGVTGLNKAFIKAGSKNIVMSLWSVSDKETAELMKEFYLNIKNTNDYPKSLQNAKLMMIKKNIHPFYWSAFILNGA